MLFLNKINEITKKEVKINKLEDEIEKIMNVFNQNKDNKPETQNITNYIDELKQIIINEKNKDGNVDENSILNVKRMCEILDYITKKLFNQPIKTKLKDVEFTKENTGITYYLLEIKKIKLNYLKLLLSKNQLKQKISKDNNEKNKYKENINLLEETIKFEKKAYYDIYNIVNSKKISKYKENKYTKELNGKDLNNKKNVLKLLYMGSEYLKQLNDIINAIKKGTNEELNQKLISIEGANNSAEVSA